nr:hypothetical protein [Tanacetum cinerariifolium]
MSINEEDDWELINDDGFVYKRLKRHNQTPTFTQPPPPPPADPLALAQAQRKRKKTILLDLKNKYQKEINQWEHLSNTLTALQNKPPVTVPLVVHQSGGCSPESSSDNAFRELADKVLAQVEAQEATINEVSRLCDSVEALCDAEEQRLKHPLFDLPIWEPSCKVLMASLQVEE